MRRRPPATIGWTPLRGEEATVIDVFDNDSGAPLGTISEEQLAFLSRQLEEESPDDTDYYINRETIDLLAQRGADAQLIDLLKRAIGDRPDLEIRWERRGDVPGTEG
jgi:hypothetical protein